jgi:Mitochondrial export protein Som1
MAPPEHPFPISELEQRVHITTSQFKEKSRKLPRDFDLKRDCELFELVQYSCTTADQIYAKKKHDPMAPAQTECFPFVRLFRRFVAPVYLGSGC